MIRRMPRMDASIGRSLSFFCGIFGVLVGCWPNHWALAQEKPAVPQQFTFSVTGLFSPDREKEFRDLFLKLPKYKLVTIDFAKAQLTIEQDPRKTWPNEKAERFVQILDNDLRDVSRGLFGVKAPSTRPWNQLQVIEIPVAGLDCLGCALGTYRLIYQLPGVEKATVDFRAGKVTAVVDPEIIKRTTLEKALKQGGVEVMEKEDK